MIVASQIHIGKRQFVEELGVDSELDFGDFNDFSPLEDNGIDFYHGTPYRISAYTKGLENAIIRNRYKNCIVLILQELSVGKTVYYHCNAGADRTGVLSFIIEGLLGVSESDLAKDYELTSFSAFGSRQRCSNEYCQFVSFIKQNFNGMSINEKIEAMVTNPIEEGGFGLSKYDVVLLRQLLVE